MTSQETDFKERSALLPATRSISVTRLWIWTAGLVVFLLGFGAAAWRVNRAPDIFTDEILYTRLAVRAGGEGALVWDSGEPFVVHPPLYFLSLAAFQALTGQNNLPLYGPGDIFSMVYHARLLNALLAGLTALLLYHLGRKWYNPWLGLFMAALFVIDPFGVRINRRAMLETLAVLLSMAGMAVFLDRQEGSPRSRLGRAAGTGLLLGLALLAKELAFINLLAVLVFEAWEAVRIRFGRLPGKKILDPILEGVVAGGLALLTYALYPLWMLVSGSWWVFIQEKLLGIERVLGMVQLTGWNRPGVSLVEFLRERLLDYGSTYLLLGLGAAATVWLLLKARDQRVARILVAWGLVLYPFFGFTALFGSGNDQFFYFLLVPALVIVSYALFDFSRRVHLPVPKNVQPVILPALLLLLILPYNLSLWVIKFGRGQDNAYSQLVAFVNQNVPADAPLNASGDPIKFRYFLPQRVTVATATSQEAQQAGLHYFVLAPKDVEAHYGRITPELADWIQKQGVLLFSTGGDSYGSLFLYRVDYPPLAGTTSQQLQVVENKDGRHWRSFHPAKGAPVSWFLTGLLAWGVLSVGLLTWSGAWRAEPDEDLIRDDERT